MGGHSSLMTAIERTVVPTPPRRNSDRGRPAGGGRPQRSDRSGRPARANDPTRSPHDTGDPVRKPRFAEPRLPEGIDPKLLDRQTRAGLRSLSTELADKIAAHLVAAGELLDVDPERAVVHTRYARNLAPRLAVVREAFGVASYRNGDFATALTELRALRRMTGDPSYLPMMADSERGLGRPERAIDLGNDPDARRLKPAERVELAIVVSGARRDRGETKAAVVALHGPDLDRSDVQPWTARLWYAYASALQDDGRLDEARQWFESVVTIDDDEDTDAQDRLAQLDAGA